MHDYRCRGMDLTGIYILFVTIVRFLTMWYFINCTVCI